MKNTADDLFATVSSHASEGLRKLDVVKMSYVGAENLTWEELFSGFDSLKAITFSSGIGFVCQLVDRFKEAEIIFGCEEVMSGTFQDIIAYQSKLVERLRAQSKSQDKLASRIDAGTLHLRVARGQLSHEKLYLLSAESGEKRVVMGSANMSFNAFGGRQRENICYIDGQEAYDWYLDVFNVLRDNSTDEISKKALVVADCAENIDELPVSKTVQVKQAIYIEPVPVTEDVQFILDVRNLSKKIAPNLPSSSAPNKKTGRVLIVPDTIVKVRRQIMHEQEQERVQRSEYPQLKVDIESATVSLNGKELDLNPPADDIAHDVEMYLKYMDGYSRFHGEWQDMQMRYFEFANWFFCSPFMATMRDMAARHDHNRLPYPVFGLLYGQSKAGKTSFLETLLKMMIGQKTKISAPDFTRKEIAALKSIVQGAPIIVDDLTQTRFNQHAVETIKWDDFGVVEHNVNYPAVVISANEDVKAIAQEVTRRTVICRVQAGLTNTEVMKSNIVRTCQQKMGTAFYREYLRRMLEVIPDMMNQLKSDEAEDEPDILAASSNVLQKIIEEHVTQVPQYVRNLSLESYFSEEVTGKHAIKVIQMAWRTSRKSFAVNTRVNELRYNAGATFEVDRLIKELPETLEPRKSRDWLIVNLDSAREFFGINFRSSIIDRFLGR